MKITINLPDHEGADEEITAEHIMLAAQINDDGMSLHILGQTNTILMAMQVHKLHAALRRDHPSVLALAEAFDTVKNSAEVEG